MKEAGSFKVGIRFAAVSAEIRRYCDDYRTVLKEAGWEIKAPKEIIITREGQGVQLLLANRKKVPPGADELYAAIKSEGIKIVPIEMKNWSDDDLEVDPENWTGRIVNPNSGDLPP